MFENIEQLEREVQEFRKNILASSELVASFERMIAQIKEQTKVFEDASKAMTDAIGQQIAAVTAQSTANAEASERNAQMLSEQIDRMSVSDEQRMVKQSEGFVQATKVLETAIGQKTEEFGEKVDSTLEEQINKLTAANQAQIRIALDTMEKTKREFAEKCDEASRSFVSIQADLNARYEQVLTKLEAANVSETVRLSKSIIKSINVKFGILLTGTIASIVLAVLAFIK